MQKNILIGGLIIGALILGYVGLKDDGHSSHKQETSAHEEGAPERAVLPDDMQGDVKEHSMHAITYSKSGFTEKTLTIKAGDMVTFTNTSDEELAVTFGEHDDHAEYPDKKEHPELETGMSDTITFPSSGTFMYHNHHNDENMGTIVVN